MKDSFTRGSLPCIATLAALLLAGPAAELAALASGWDTPSKAIKYFGKRDLNREDQDQVTAGYYEDLLGESRRVASTGNLLAGNMAANWTTWTSERLNTRTVVKRGDFLYYSYKPNVVTAHAEDHLVTNSQGLADKEYELSKPPGVRRLAVVGDSIIRGLGAPFGGNFESLLEQELNRSQPAAAGKYELINFSVHGYRITQLMEVVLEQAPRFSPDAYIVGLTDLSVFRAWGWHIAQLYHDGVDLKYPYLRELARKAKLSPADDRSVFDSKLAPYRVETLRWVLNEMQQHAAARKAGLLVVLVPTVTQAAEQSAQFEDTRRVLADLHIPFIDLMDTFSGIEDLDRYRISQYNMHPNAAGHELLFRSLYGKLRANAQATAIVVGQQRAYTASR